MLYLTETEANCLYDSLEFIHNYLFRPYFFPELRHKVYMYIRFTDYFPTAELYDINRGCFILSKSITKLERKKCKILYNVFNKEGYSKKLRIPQSVIQILSESACRYITDVQTHSNIYSIGINEDLELFLNFMKWKDTDWCKVDEIPRSMFEELNILNGMLNNLKAFHDKDGKLLYTYSSDEELITSINSRCDEAVRHLKSYLESIYGEGNIHSISFKLDSPFSCVAATKLKDTDKVVCICCLEPYWRFSDGNRRS